MDMKDKSLTSDFSMDNDITGGKREEFMQRVQSSVRLKDMPLVIACSEGPVSMVACKQLQDAGRITLSFEQMHTC